MKRYRDVSGESGIAAFEITGDSISVKFKEGGVYLYDSTCPGRATVEKMKRLALSGKNLCTFINRHVRDRYAAKLK